MVEATASQKLSRLVAVMPESLSKPSNRTPEVSDGSGDASTFFSSPASFPSCSSPPAALPPSTASVASCLPPSSPAVPVREHEAASRPKPSAITHASAIRP